ncbi:LysM peptidoglycan-binding domain-containing protein [Litchfieldia salsa]|uniref:Spore germination protein YaaH n=1 Tax=Litchfieldia salsa TaxID=930152 RepID=A0A1H0WCY9_9BACI|nr:LysM peptidoglycan-binding domain-containing protein [Litchfieldia salsa]SDP88572.1 Spore germination protein YaaH [Litchfieldia salsa]
MDFLQKYELNLNPDNSYTLVIHLNQPLTEFAQELGYTPGKKDDFHLQLKQFVKQSFPRIKVSSVKVMVGALLVTSYYFVDSTLSSALANTTTQTQQLFQYDTYTVQSGDTLYSLSRRFNVTVSALKELNTLSTDTLKIGQVLKLPYFTYTVTSGDTLYTIAKKHQTTAIEIKTFNQLSSDVIHIGQKLRVPQPITQPTIITETTTTEPTTTNDTIYTVISGDTLSIIAKKFNITVEAIKSHNNLTTDLIYIGQKLTIPMADEQPTTEQISNDTTSEPEQAPDTISYTVISGDTLSLIANKFNTTVENLKNHNGLSSDRIFVGQVLLIPKSVTQPVAEEPIIESGLDTSSIEGTIYTVVPGDTLSLIAKKFNTTVDLVKTTNNLTSDLIFVGQKLTVPSTEQPVVEVDHTAPEQPRIGALPIITTQNVTEYIVSGTAEANASIEILIQDGVHSPIRHVIQASETGEYTQTINLSSLQDGQLTILVQATDNAGNQSTPLSEHIVKDTVSVEPILNANVPINYENVHQYVLIGKAEPGSTVVFTISDGFHPDIHFTTTANESGDINELINLTGLNDGAIILKAHSIDLVGNQSSVTEATVMKETMLYTPTIENSTVVNGANVSNYTIAGHAQPRTVIDLIVSDGVNPPVLASVLTDDNGEYASVLDLSMLVDTDLKIEVKATSEAGISSDSETVMIKKDTVSPDAPSLNNTGYINAESQTSYSLTGQADPLALVTIVLTNHLNQYITITTHATESGDYTLPVDVSQMTDGDLFINFTQTDSAGNVSYTSKSTLVKDTVGPSLFTPQPIVNIFSGNQHDYILSGTTEVNGLIGLTISDGTNTISRTTETNSEGAFEIPLDTSGLNDGELIVQYYVTDQAGNVQPQQPITILKDTTAPSEVTLATPEYVNKSNMEKFLVKGINAEDAVTIRVLITDGTNTTEGVTTAASGVFEIDMNLGTLKDGPLRIEVVQTDKAGNTSIVQTQTVEKDTVVDQPVISKSGFSIVNGGLVYTIIGTAEANSAVTVFLSDLDKTDQLSKSTTTNERGFFTITIPLYQLSTTDNLSIRVQQSDQAENVSEEIQLPTHSYLVSADDTLFTIAKRFNTTVDALRSMNHLTSTTVSVGQTLRLPVTASTVLNLGYLYFGNTKEYVNTVNGTNQAINVVSPSYFDINTDGSLKLTYQLDPAFIESMHQQGIRVVPFLSNHWNREIGRAMLQNKEQAAQQIADAIAKYNLDGVNVDLENITDADRANFTEFVRLLRLKIPTEKEVSVAVAANPNGWNTGWHGAYDYNSLSKYADYLMIMSYDESYHGGDPGPVASLPWVERSIQYAINQGVARDKIVMGMAHYGRYWIEGLDFGGFGISNSKIEELLTKYEHTLVFDETSQSVKATVIIKAEDPVTFVSGSNLTPGTYTIWFENAESVTQKLALVAKYEIRGVGNWSLGQENTNIWTSFTTSMPATTPLTSVSYTEEQSIYTIDHTVVSGESLWAIATRYKTTITAIKDVNNLTSDTLYIGQVLKIPQVEPIVTEEAVTTTVTTYTVTSGDSLWLIASRFNTTVTAIKEANNLTSDTINVGQVLIIP